MKDGGVSLDMNQFDLSSKAGRESYKQMLLSNADYTMVSPEELSKSIDEQLNDYIIAEGRLKGVEHDRKFLETEGPNKDKIQRFLELKEKAETPLTDEYFDAQEEALEAKQEQKYEDYVQQGLKKEVEKGDLTAYEAERARSKFGWGTQVDTVLSDYKTEHGTDYNFAPATAAEKFLENQYKAWTNAWKDMLSHTLQNTVGVNVNVNQETSRSNPV